MFQRIVITGGTGFVGRTLCERLVEISTEVQLVVPTRQLPQARPVQLLPTVEVRRCNVHDPAEAARLLAGADALVHLVAILHGDDAAFDRVHVQLPRTLATAARAAGIQRVVHVSALAAAPDAPSAYLRSKAAGEAAWRDSRLSVQVLRPSVVFGADDRFTNLFAGLQRWFPVLPLAGADARFQPVWVDDVARAIIAGLKRPQPIAPAVNCAGPEVLTLRQIVGLVGRMAGCERPVWALPEGIGMLQASLMGLLPGQPLLSRDNLKSMRVPSFAPPDEPGLASLGINPSPLAMLAPHFAPARPAYAQ